MKWKEFFVGRFLIVLAVIFSLAMPAAGAFAFGMAGKCKCPDMTHCVDHDCGAAACHAVPAPSMSVPPGGFSFHAVNADAPQAGAVSALSPFQPSSQSKPPCRS